MAYSVGTKAIVETPGQPVAFPMDNPQVVLVSSLSIRQAPPGGGCTAPEPRFCLVTGLVMVAPGRLRRRRPIA